MSETADVELLHRVWEALSRGDLSVLEGALAPEAKWRAFEDGPWNCESREEIIDVMQGNLARGFRGRIEETVKDGERVVVGFRPERSWQAGEPLDAGVIYMVVTVREDRIAEMKRCSDRAAAIAYARTGMAPTAEALDAVRAPDTTRDPPEQRVSNLIPFVHVADVERSIDFYRQLGFRVKSIFKPGERLLWAALESEGAQLMLTQASAPVECERQAVLFYLYSHYLQALREQLIAAGIEAGEITDGSPGPRQEMRLQDPDGYVLMVAQIE
jgi:ketosteroid isomerase-like protein/catechol 2,3-dioxygenase-like lactoylglutathione lyase family enzyme